MTYPADEDEFAVVSIECGFEFRMNSVPNARDMQIIQRRDQFNDTQTYQATNSSKTAVKYQCDMASKAWVVSLHPDYYDAYLAGTR